MSTSLHTFIDIFDLKTDDEKCTQLTKIVIPLIQRDYAQGRQDKEIVKVRERFLESLKSAIMGNPITLDFVYGDIDENGVMTPLDGQQRLTTLFLLHWYAAKKEGVSKEDYAFLKNFSYETRYSARDFCENLITFEPTFSVKISDEIIDQTWFPLDWKKDQTISSMLVMLDAIDEHFKNVNDIWSNLKKGAITFYFLPIKDMGLTDELYIKMNSRGKPLTEFEHFKAELEREIRAVDEKITLRITNKIDNGWTDLLWNYRDNDAGVYEDDIIGNEFLRYFKFVCDVLCYRMNDSPQKNVDDDVFDLLHKYFSVSCSDAYDNILSLESFFDCWCNTGYNNPAQFLESFMGRSHEQGKIIVESRYKIDIFEDCVRSYSDKTVGDRSFPLMRMVLLYAITIYLQNKDNIKESDFIRRIRIVNNLIRNSQDQISDRTDRSRMPGILKAVDSIILYGDIDDSIELNFSVHQLKEEKEKIEFLKIHPEQAEELFTLEDHERLYGQIGILGIDNLNLSQRFISLFNCDLDKIDCALMTKGNYAQQERNKWRYQFASVNVLSWNSLFHKSDNEGFKNTSDILIKLLKSTDNFSNDFLDKIIFDFINEHESKSTYPWEYYYIKYNSFRPGNYGKMWCNDTNNPTCYLYTVMKSKQNISTTSYVPYLKEADETHLDSSTYGQRLRYGDTCIRCRNDSYEVYEIDKEGEMETEKLVKTIAISQNSEGIDIENRVELLKHYIKDSGLLKK